MVASANDVSCVFNASLARSNSSASHFHAVTRFAIGAIININLDQLNAQQNVGDVEVITTL
ncbi:MAG: hypothetical protein H7240_09185 [Glaciimonas sp.]|nr:hypothetical protein [Glaciimonas sp.]